MLKTMTNLLEHCGQASGRFHIAASYKGCEINFETSAQDFAYRAGRPIIAGGSIALYIEPFGMMLKPGVADVLNNNIVEVPYYAFIKTSNGSTAGSIYESHDAVTKAIACFLLKLIKQQWP